MKEKINNIITILQKEIITSTADLQNFKSKYTCILSNIISDFKMLPLEKKKPTMKNILITHYLYIHILVTATL